MFKPIQYTQKTLAERAIKLLVSPEKKVNCLRCDRIFMGRVNVRICYQCKETDNYKHDSLYTFMSAKQVS